MVSTGIGRTVGRRKGLRWLSFGQAWPNMRTTKHCVTDYSKYHILYTRSAQPATTLKGNPDEPGP